MPGKTLTAVLIASTLALGCEAGGPPPDGTGGGAGEAATGRDGAARPRGAGASRPDTITDTLHLEGMAEPIRLSLFRAPEPFPLPFSAYVPTDMAATADDPTGAGHVRFVAEFGGQRNADAFVHLFVFPPNTDGNRAIALARGYKASRGIPVSQGLEPLSDEDATRRMPWALEAYRFRYQSGGEWFMGTIGIGEHDGRFFQLVRHYPAEYADGFAPRASLITRTWRWQDGGRLIEAPGAPPAGSSR